MNTRMTEQDILNYTIKLFDYDEKRIIDYRFGDIFTIFPQSQIESDYFQSKLIPECIDYLSNYYESDDFFWSPPEKCMCRKPVRKGKSSKEPNIERTYYSCGNQKKVGNNYIGGCKFFQWGYLEPGPETDEFGNIIEPEHICRCGHVIVTPFECKKGPNQGKWFFTCPAKKYNPVTKKSTGGCDYFKFAVSDIRPVRNIQPVQRLQQRQHNVYRSFVRR